MLADIVCILWLLMSAVLGWKRTSSLEFPSLLLTVLSYGLARLISPTLAEVVDGIAKKGVLTGAAIATLLLWPILYLVLHAVWKKIRPHGGSRSIRIRVDADGNPMVNQASLLSRNALGTLFGLMRGVVLYSGILYILLLIIPSSMYKDGRGTVIVHPKSISLKWIRRWDPTLRRMDQVNRGLQLLYGIKTRAKLRQKAYRTPQIAALLNSPDLITLSRNHKLLTRAVAPNQGLRDSTLLLWLKSYQKAVFYDSSALALKKLVRSMK